MKENERKVKENERGGGIEIDVYIFSNLSFKTIATNYILYVNKKSII